MTSTEGSSRTAPTVVQVLCLAHQALGGEIVRNTPCFWPVFPAREHGSGATHRCERYRNARACRQQAQRHDRSKDKMPLVAMREQLSDLPQIAVVP